MTVRYSAVHVELLELDEDKCETLRVRLLKFQVFWGDGMCRPVNVVRERVEVSKRRER